MSNIKLAGLYASIFYAILALPAHAYDSGSSGADGELVPLEDMVVALPDGGVLNYTRVQIPSGVTVTFQKNASNTPVRVLVSGDVVVAGTISVSGRNAPATGAAGTGDTSDDGNPGLGGPGGYDGGRGGRVRPTVGDDRNSYSPEDALAISGEWGRGPGGGAAGRLYRSGSTYSACSATAANYSIISGITIVNSRNQCAINGQRVISAYGTGSLLPLIGGSGGGGTIAASGINGTGGGGGGGAILIAASGAVNITGSILADGGSVGGMGDNRVRRSGGGSGGAIRIIATTISGNGNIYARGGTGRGGTSNGRIRVEAERFRFSGRSTPQYTLGSPGSLYLANRPSVRISSVGTQSVPNQPSGDSDVTFAEVVEENTSISISASNVPLDTVVTVNVVPAAGDIVKATSTALAGTVASSTATATVRLPAGPSVIQAVASFAVSAEDAQLQSMYMPYTNGELVAHVSMDTSGDVGMTLTTASGRKIAVPVHPAQ